MDGERNCALDDKIRQAVSCSENWRRRESESEKRERLRTQEENSWKSRLLESSFEGETHEIKKIFKELNERNIKEGLGDDEVSLMIKRRRQQDLVNCRDANGNTPISEAAAGGNAETVNLLIQKGADPNIRGQFQRTAIYRAAFAGHLEVCQILLRNGADPRLYAEDGQTPQMIASIPSVQALLRAWDLSVTESMLETIAVTTNLSETQKKKVEEDETERLRNLFIAAQVEWKKRHEQLVKAQEDVNNLQDEDSPGTSHAMDMSEALTTLKVAEIREEQSRVRMDDLHRKFSTLAVQIPVIQSDESTCKNSKVVNFRDLNDQLMRDVDGSIESSGMWPLVIDNTNQTAVFFRYCDTNYLDSYLPRNMESESIRRAVIGGIRFGKPVVVDLQGTDMFDAVSMKFDEVLPGLMALILSKEILEEENYMQLVKSSDGEEYDRNKFREERIKNFKFLLLTKLERPSQELVDKMFVIRVKVASRVSRTRQEN